MHQRWMINYLEIFFGTLFILRRRRDAGSVIKGRSLCREENLFDRGRKGFAGKVLMGKCSADLFFVEVEPLADFIKMVTSELFEQCIGNHGCHNCFSNNTSRRHGTSVAAFKA